MTWAVALGSWHFKVGNPKVVVAYSPADARCVVAAFLMYPNLVDVVGVELCHSRFLLGEKAVLQLASSFSADFAVVDWTQGHTITLASTQVCLLSLVGACWCCCAFVVVGIVLDASTHACA